MRSNAGGADHEMFNEADGQLSEQEKAAIEGSIEAHLATKVCQTCKGIGWVPGSYFWTLADPCPDRTNYLCPSCSGENELTVYVADIDAELMKHAHRED